MDWPFRFSLIGDIVEGLNFIHSSGIEYHGRLKSTNCVIDRRLVVKLTDYGLRSLMSQTISESHIDPRQLLWTAPEHLRQKRAELRGSAKGDVYSFSIVLQEIVTRSGPFETSLVRGSSGCESLPSPVHYLPAVDPASILVRIRRIATEGVVPFRPLIPDDECPLVLGEIIRSCWQEVPADRPTVDSVRQQLKKITK